jgi:hypothetical protein
MYTEDDLRAVFGDVEREAPDLPGTLVGLDRLRKRRTLRRTAVGMVAAVATTVAVAATALVVARLAEHTATPAAPPATPLRFSFALDPFPDHGVVWMARDATRQQASLDPLRAGEHQSAITVFASGAFDPADARAGEPVEVNGRHGYYRPDLPCQCDAAVVLPAIALEYTDNAWATVAFWPDSGGPQGAGDLKAKLAQVAETVRFDRTTPVLIPYRVGYLPAGLRPRSVNVLFDLPGATQPTSLGWPVTGDLSIEYQSNKPGGPMPPVGQPRVGPVTTTLPHTLGMPSKRLGVANFGQWSVRVTAAELSDAEMLRIMRSITPTADYGNRAKWFDAEEAIPNG